MRLIVFSVFEKYFVHICRGVLVQFVGRTKDNQSDFAIAKNAQFVSFFHDAKLAFIEGNLRETSVSFRFFAKYEGLT